MDALGTNPFAVITFIAAPAILTNASTVISLTTGNRFARAIDRFRKLVELAEAPETTPAEAPLYLSQLAYAERRVLLLVRALTAFYLAIGSFAAAGLVALLGATLVLLQVPHPLWLVVTVPFLAGLVGVGGLVFGSLLLVIESRMTLALLRVEHQMVRGRLARLRTAGIVPSQ